MSDLRRTGAARLAVGAGVLAIAAVVIGCTSEKKEDNPGAGAAPADSVGFREMAQDAGITWRMNFLNGEQGETFKINLYDHGSGVAVGDFDGDGYDDIYFLNQFGPNALYRNNRDGTFTDVTKQCGVAMGDRVCVAATWADYDNDGYPDLFVTSTRGGNVLFHNVPDGHGGRTFVDVTKEAGLVHVGHSQAGVFFDYDNDGYLDLLVTNTAGWTTDQFVKAGKHFSGKGDLTGVAGSPIESNILYHNVPDGHGGRTFVDVTKKSGLKGIGWNSDVAVFDYDGDGRLDVLITNMFGRSQLYRNEGGGKFREVTKQVLGPTSWGATGIKAFDGHNDGKLDVYILDMHSDMWMGLKYDWPERHVKMIAAGANKKYKHVTGPGSEYEAIPAEKERETADYFKVKYDEVLFGNTFFRNLGNGKLEEVSDKAGLETLWPWGCATGDFDNDGYQDIFISSGMGYPFFYWPNALMMNKGDGTFTDRARDFGIDPPPGGPYQDLTIRGPDGKKRHPARSSRAAATADFDHDGRLDLVVNNFNDRPYYYRNNFPKKNYIAFRLTGTKSNRDAIGALVRLHIDKEVMLRQVDPSMGYLAQSSRTLHFGLGDRTTIDRVDIQWPSGIRQTIQGPDINRLHEVTEPKK